MKNLLYFLGSLAVALVAAFLVHYWLSANDDPGYVLLGFGGWSLETSMVVFAVSSVFTFFGLYVFFRVLGWLIRLPTKMKASPSPKLRRQCNPAGCRYHWHTFATHGVCPRCSKMWHDTQCPRCKLRSLIDDWYHADESSRLKSLKEKQSEKERELSVLLPNILDKAFKGEL